MQDSLTTSDISKHPFTERPSPYTLGALDVREVKGIPYIHNKAAGVAVAKFVVGSPLILMFHRCSTRCIATVVKLLRFLGYRLTILGEVYEHIVKGRIS